MKQLKKAQQKFVGTHEGFFAENWTPIKKVVRDFPVGLSIGGGNRFRVEWKQLSADHMQNVTIQKFSGITKDNLDCV